MYIGSIRALKRFTFIYNVHELARTVHELSSTEKELSSTVHELARTVHEGAVQLRIVVQLQMIFAHTYLSKIHSAHCIVYSSTAVQ